MSEVEIITKSITTFYVVQLVLNNDVFCWQVQNNNGALLVRSFYVSVKTLSVVSSKYVWSLFFFMYSVRDLFSFIARNLCVKFYKYWVYVCSHGRDIKT